MTPFGVVILSEASQSYREANFEVVILSEASQSYREAQSKDPLFGSRDR